MGSTMASSMGQMTLEQPTHEGAGSASRQQEVAPPTTRSLSGKQSLSFRMPSSKGKLSLLARRQMKKSCSVAEPSGLIASDKPGSAPQEKLDVSHRPMSTDSNKLSKLNLSLNLGRSQNGSKGSPFSQHFQP